MKTFLYRSVLGIFFGAFITVLITSAVIYFGGQPVLDGELFIKNAFGYIFCGWLFTVTPLYFEIRSIGLAMQTLLHFLTVTILYFILGLGIGWIPFDIQNFLLYAAISIIVYTIAWIGFYLYFKNESRKLNKDLKCIE
ncbi:DUF3021 domain-containing protein [Halobacillus sp. Marseille-Q1614]|uniref:DUF3021 domain-containing protein n=1 Tax=Halobacillus sp. Marseille-Q1614 TaxID=2709134 RepID=UPI00156FC5B1|nr:DUF3021 domain-containing protein [Halobacillus sp. Marseille-Q1614]